MTDFASYSRLSPDLVEIGYSMIVTFDDPEIGEKWKSLVKRRDDEMVLVSAEVSGNIARLRFDYTRNLPLVLMMAMDFRPILSKCEVLAKEREVVDQRFKLRPNRLPNDLIHICRLLPQNAVVAELGSFAGEGAEQFRKSGKVSRIICVDHWENTGNTREAFEWRMRNPRLLGEVTVLAMKTSDAAPLIEDGSLDMAYVDASHDYSSVKQDIETWLPKVKSGGYISGHDWHLEHFGVVRAVIDAIGKPDGVCPDTSWYKRKQ